MNAAAETINGASHVVSARCPWRPQYTRLASVVPLEKFDDKLTLFGDTTP